MSKIVKIQKRITKLEADKLPPSLEQVHVLTT